MKSENRKQEPQMGIFAGDFLLETDRRNEADQVKRCQAYAEAESGRKSEK